MIHSRMAAIESRFGGRRPHLVEDSASTAMSRAGQGVHVFDGVYANAVHSPASPTPAHRLAPGAYGRLQPPAELVALGNGQIPAGVLDRIGGDDHQLYAPAAEAFGLLESAASADGVSLGIIASYRDLTTQQRLAAEKGLYSQGGLAASPGTSNHGWGLSLDLDPAAQAWMREHAWRFGFVEDVPREPWHWTYRPAA